MTACVPGLPTSGLVASRIMSSETKIRASPIRIRPIWRMLPAPRRKIPTPISSSSGIRNACRTINSCVTKADPTSAPSRMTKPAEAASPPFETKFETKTATAVELCSNTAAPIPVAAARNLFLAECRSQIRRGVAKPRSTPVRTSLTAQIKRAAAPAILSKN